ERVRTARSLRPTFCSNISILRNMHFGLAPFPQFSLPATRHMGSNRSVRNNTPKHFREKDCSPAKFREQAGNGASSLAAERFWRQVTSIQASGFGDDRQEVGL